MTSTVIYRSPDGGVQILAGAMIPSTPGPYGSVTLGPDNGHSPLDKPPAFTCEACLRQYPAFRVHLNGNTRTGLFYLCDGCEGKPVVELDDFVQALTEPSPFRKPVHPLRRLLRRDLWTLGGGV